MTQTERPQSPIRPKRPSPMDGERGMTLREAIEILTPRWLRRSSRGGRSGQAVTRR